VMFKPAPFGSHMQVPTCLLPCVCVFR
jgi:hypothetical protein